MTWLMMSLRRSELTRSYSQHCFEKLQVSRKRQKLANFSNAVSSGTISPAQIASLGGDFFFTGLNFMAESNAAADQVAAYQTQEYCNLYGQITQSEYYNNPSVANGASLYFDENGQLNESAMYSKFYEQALKDYVEKYVQPWLKEQEEQMENQQNELETLTELEKAELDQLKQSISSEIQNSAIKL